jgi:DNA-directed RNA polymerase, mitochondrial
VQPYKSISQKDIINTIIQNISVADDLAAQPVNKSKQSSAFPPNYVHSIDSTHMMLTAIRCRDEGISFAGVHDSFWTHPGDVDRLGQILRAQFVKLHSAPLIDTLH